MPLSVPQLDAVRHVAQAIGKGEGRVASVSGPWATGKTLIAAQAAANLGRSMLVLAPRRIEAEAILDDLATFLDPEACVFFPAWEVAPTDLMAPADDIVAERMHALEIIARRRAAGQPVYAAASMRAFMQYVAPPEDVAGGSVTLAAGTEHPIESLLATLLAMGYEREMMVEQRGQMSVRGGIFDLFPISSELPVRIEFFGDEIESIRRFEPETQRSIDEIASIAVMPRSEKGMLQRAADEDRLAALTDYFPDDAIVTLDEPAGLAAEAKALAEQLGDTPYCMAADAVWARLARFSRLELAQLPAGLAEDGERIDAPMQPISGWQRDAEGFWKQLETWDQEKRSVWLICNNPGERGRLLELLQERGYRPGQDSFDLHVELGRLRGGFFSNADGLAMLSEREIFGRKVLRRRRRRFEAGESVKAFGDLKVGDYVVHDHHGIGRYDGIRRFSGKSGDFLAIQYAKGDKLYLPASHIDSIQKYSAGDGAMPRVDRLGGATWAKTKARVKKAVRDMTQELVSLYAARESQEGHAFPADTHWQQEFESEFPYDETPDQLRAIQDVKRDMESSRPMDRLLCGDVGYGKTEVALRAAFKAVMDGVQVAMLAPTTVLTEQHYNTFAERLADYPIEVGMLSRFRTTKENKVTLERIQSGEADIVIGTHRLLSKDVRFKNLGLLIIDEEQRFGVAHKERMKQLRTQIDVLTMSATPIPRTLNMAMLGSRDMSLINTAPNDRLPVHTCIENYDERLIAEALSRELARQGQVFFLHNRVQNIIEMAETVRRLAPTARVAVGHGQMPEKELEKVMLGFVDHDIDVLVCTTIIGSGIDIPNANTIIINNADHFGLAELYQLRGRVGRYKHRAFAYLLVPGDRILSEDAQKRLKALEEFSTLGSGFRIAMRDLEIRGAGNLLGGEQSGNIQAVGFDTFADLIKEAVAEVKGQPIVRRSLPPFDLAIDAFIPRDYVPSEAQKITLYKRIAGVQDADEVDEMAEELRDRFGPVPESVQRLLDVMRVRALGAETRVRRLVSNKGAVTAELENGRLLTDAVRGALSQELGGRIEFAYKEIPAITYDAGAQSAEESIQAAERLLRALAEA